MAIVRTAVAVLALVVAPLALTLTPLAHGTQLIYVGMIPTLVACLHGYRFALATALIAALLVAAVSWANPHPLEAALLMVVVGAAVGLSSLRGWHTVASVVASWPAVLLISVPLELPTPAWSAEPGGSIVAAALIAGAGGLWTIAVVAILLPALPRSSFEPLERTPAIIYATGLALLLGVCTFVAATWWHGTTAGWVLLTILVIARPAYSQTRRRVLERSTGTIAGGVAAALLSVLVPVHVVLTVVGAGALAAAVLLQLKHANYLVYSLSLTSAIVLLNAGTVDVLAIDVQRVGYTVAGALVTALALTVVQLLFRPERPDLQESAVGS
jgi:fusaric acid resistance family protein